MASTNGKPSFTSGPQVIMERGFGSVVPSVNGSGEGKSRLVSSMLPSDRQFNEMLRDPTIKLATKIQTAMLIVQPWIVDGEDDDFCTYCFQQIEQYRTKLVRSSMRGILKHGWRAFELLYEVRNDSKSAIKGPTPALIGCKPLRNELTTPLVWEDTGEFAGLEVRDTIGGIDFIDADHAILINADEDYVGELGHAHLRNVQETHRKWEKCDEGAQRYDDKVAGGFLAIGYPIGESEIEESGARIKKNNVLIAKQFAQQIKASGFGLYPRRPDPDNGEFKDGDWKFEHVMASGGGMQPNFIARLKYLDALKLRTFGIPERAATEGSFGTKAEAEAHLSVALGVSSELMEFAVEGVNNGFMKPISREVMDDENAAKLTLGKINDEDKARLTTIFMELMKDASAGKFIRQRTDIKNVMDELEVPSTDTPQFEVEEPPAPAPGAVDPATGEPVPGAEPAVDPKTGKPVEPEPGAKPVPPGKTPPATPGDQGKDEGADAAAKKKQAKKPAGK